MHSLASEILVVANIILLCAEINGLFPFPRFGGHIGEIAYTQSSNMHSSTNSELPEPKKIERGCIYSFFRRSMHTTFWNIESRLPVVPNTISLHYL